jgi:hypothetical protein
MFSARFSSRDVDRARCYTREMYAQKFSVEVVIAGERKPCPLDWLDSFSMRNFTNAAEFDDVLPLADGRIEASFRVKPERYADALGAWLTQRGKGEGKPVKVEVRKIEAVNSK